MKPASFALTLFALFSFEYSSSAYAQGASTTYTKADGRKCHGTFVAPRVMATVAHCLDDFRTGGVRLDNGERSESVMVASTVRRSGRNTNDDDFALVVFPSSHSYAPVFRSRIGAGGSLTVVTARHGIRKIYTERFSQYTSNSTRTADIYIGTSNSNGLAPGDSGAALYDGSSRLLGILRGCVPSLCGFVSLHRGNPVVDETWALAAQRFPQYFGGTGSVLPGPGPNPETRNYECQAECKIEYARPYAVAYETVKEILIKASSSRVAADVGMSGLKSNCQEYCSFSRDAQQCTIVSAPSCYLSR